MVLGGEVGLLLGAVVLSILKINAMSVEKEAIMLGTAIAIAGDAGAVQDPGRGQETGGQGHEAGRGPGHETGLGAALILAQGAGVMIPRTRIATNFA